MEVDKTTSTGIRAYVEEQEIQQVLYLVSESVVASGLSLMAALDEAGCGPCSELLTSSVRHSLILRVDM